MTTHIEFGSRNAEVGIKKTEVRRQIFRLHIVLLNAPCALPYAHTPQPTPPHRNRHPAPRIQNPVSSIQNPASIIQHPETCTSKSEHLASCPMLCAPCSMPFASTFLSPPRLPHSHFRIPYIFPRSCIIRMYVSAPVLGGT